MKGLNLIVFSFLLLAPIQYPGRSGVKEISGEHVEPRHSPQKTTSHNSSLSHQRLGEGKKLDREPLTAKVVYELSDEPNCDVPKDDGGCPKEAETKKESSAKWKSILLEKSKNRETRGSDDGFRTDFPGEKFRRSSGMTRTEANLCADCDKCEIQVKTNGGGIVLKCQKCRQVSQDEIPFPSGNNLKIVHLP